MALFRERGNSRHGNGNLEHRHGAHVNLVPVKIGFYRSLLALGVRLYLFLLFLVTSALGLVDSLGAPVSDIFKSSTAALMPFA